MYSKIKQLAKKVFLKINPTYVIAKRTENRLNIIDKKIDQYGYQNQMMFWWQLTPPDGSLMETQKQFYLHMPNAEQEIRVVQLANLYLLRKVKQICEENHIQYWVQGGTLLGAIRHQGYIPWDDDLDVGMMRDDLERFRKIVDEKYNKYAVHDIFHPDIRCPKFMLRDLSIPCFVDIFPYDYCKCDEDNDMKVWNNLQIDRLRMVKELNRILPVLKKKYINEPINDKEDLALVSEIYQKYLDKQGDIKTGNAIHWPIELTTSDWPRIFRLDYFFPCCEVIFEGELFPAPNNPYDYVRKQYGHYYQLPRDVSQPHWKRFSKHIDNIYKFLEECQNSNK